MKKIIIICTIVGIVLIAGIFIITDLLSNRTVIFNLTGSGYTVVVLDKNASQIKNITTSTNLQLKEGEYSYKVLGDTYSNDAVSFSVSSNTSITVSPLYSDQYLASLLEKESSAINKVLLAKYPVILNDFKIKSLNLYEKGDWAAGKIETKTTGAEQPDVYRFVLQKINSQWNIVVPPQISINRDLYKQVPIDILYNLY
jgi:hypothetical protein